MSDAFAAAVAGIATFGLLMFVLAVVWRMYVMAVMEAVGIGLCVAALVGGALR